MTGDMLIEFCEADIQDVFMQFSDRFKIRKLMHSFPKPAQEDSQSEPIPATCPLQISNVLSHSYLEDHVKSEFTFDNVQTSAKIVSSSMSPSTVVSPHATSPSNPFSSHNRPSSSCYTAITLSDDDQEDMREASSNLNRYGDSSCPIRGPASAIMPSGDNIQLLACTYSTTELLARKEHRGKPTDAQKLGQIILRDCARMVDIWESPPLVNTISLEKREQFFQQINQIAPQLMAAKHEVWLRLREALQNRRNYLLAKQERKKRSHDKDDQSGNDVKVHCQNSMLYFQFQNETVT